MAATVKSDMLLFCKEITPYPRKYVLYFVDMRTYYDPKPRVHRFQCQWRHFARFTPGMAYNLSVSGIHIHDFDATLAYEISEADYQVLMEARALRFIPLSEARRRQKLRQPMFDASEYYSFADVREMLAYSDTLLMRIWLRVIHIVLQGVAFLLPAAVYWLLLYSSIQHVSYDATMRIPLMALAALPLMIYAMFTLVVLSEMLQLRWPYTRWALLRRRVLLSGGKRQPLRFSAENRKKFLVSGGVCFGVLALMWLILLISGMM